MRRVMMASPTAASDHRVFGPGSTSAGRARALLGPPAGVALACVLLPVPPCANAGIGRRSRAANAAIDHLQYVPILIRVSSWVSPGIFRLGSGSRFGRALTGDCRYSAREPPARGRGESP